MYRYEYKWHNIVAEYIVHTVKWYTMITLFSIWQSNDCVICIVHFIRYFSLVAAAAVVVMIVSIVIDRFTDILLWMESFWFR